MSRPLIALTCSLALAACVENNADAGFVVLRNLVPATGCVVDPTSDAFKSSGIIQSDSTSGYVFTPLVRNDLVTVEGESPTRKSIFMEGARVTISFYDTMLFSAAELTAMETAGLTKFIAPTSGAVGPDGSTATFILEVVPAELLAAIDAKLPTAGTDPTPSALLDVHVQMFGSVGGSTISSNTFRYPVEVCRDCLVSVIGACAGLDPGADYPSGGACNPVQDGQLVCCTSSTGGMVCPATAPPQN